MPRKKGNPTWAPASKLDMSNKDPKFRYRWVDRDSQNIEKKEAEGWRFVNKETGIPGEHDRPDLVEDGNPLDSTKTYRELVAMALPEEIGEARDAWVESQTRKQTISIKDRLQKEVAQGGNAEVHGKLVIE